MICVSLADISYQQCKEIIKTVPMAEIRLDRLRLDQKEIHKIFGLSPYLIATYRPGKISETERKEILITAIESGAQYVDVEIESDTAFKKDILQACLTHQRKLIISYHNYDTIPSRDELEGIIDGCFEAGAHIAKLACRVGNETEAARILSLYEKELPVDKQLVALGMGEKGRITRVAATLLGAPFTFASMDTGKETAPGQLNLQSMEEILDRILFHRMM